MKPFFRKNKRGIILLSAMIIAGAVLSISFIISIIGVRTFGISSSIRESELAFYAGESGFECVRFWSQKDRSYFSDEGQFQISCNDETFAWNPSLGTNVFDFEFGHSYTLDGNTFDYPYFSKVKVTRNPGIFNIDIDAKGYNNEDETVPERFEREVDAKISGICSYKPDIMLALDVSESIDDSEFAILQQSVSTFISSLDPKNLGVHLGISTFVNNAELLLSLSGDINDINDTVDELESYRSQIAGTNLVDGLRLARYELSGRASPSQTSPYCPISPAPDRAIVYFDNSFALFHIPQSRKYTTALNPFPTIPIGNYNVYATACDEYPLRVYASPQPNEQIQVRLYANPGQGQTFYQSNPTEDLKDLVAYAATTTLVGDNVYLSQNALSARAEHAYCFNSNGGNSGDPRCEGGSVVAVCAAFENLDGLTDFDTTLALDDDDRADESSPDYIILITDGGADYAFPCRGAGVIHGGVGSPDSLRSVALEAEAARASGIDIFVIGVGTSDVSCSGYDGQSFANCSEFLNEKVASSASPEGPDPDGNAFYFEAEDYDDLDSVLSQITNCVKPLSD